MRVAVRAEKAIRLRAGGARQLVVQPGGECVRAVAGEEHKVFRCAQGVVHSRFKLGLGFAAQARIGAENAQALLLQVVAEAQGGGYVAGGAAVAEEHVAGGEALLAADVTEDVLQGGTGLIQALPGIGRQLLGHGGQRMPLFGRIQRSPGKRTPEEGRVILVSAPLHAQSAQQRGKMSAGIAAGFSGSAEALCGPGKAALLAAQDGAGCGLSGAYGQGHVLRGRFCAAAQAMAAPSAFAVDEELKSAAGMGAGHRAIPPAVRSVLV